MKFDLKRPCPGCPFRVGDGAVRYLGRRRATQIVDSMITHDAHFSCHQTNDFSSGDVRETADSQHCAGAAIMLMRAGQPNQIMRIAGRIGWFDPKNLDMDAEVFGSFEEFIEAQADGTTR